MFLSLAKNRNLGKLSQLRRDNGENFASSEEHAEHIVSFYKNLYKKSPDEEQNFTNIIEDLDKSLKKANFRFAPGFDGFSNNLIKKCWPYLRSPLLKYANTCLTKGQLTANFRGATIKLIPKINDLSKLKNWRPISLLSNLYKIISRAIIINERLNKVVNRICSTVGPKKASTNLDSLRKFS